MATRDVPTTPTQHDATVDPPTWAAPEDVAPAIVPTTADPELIDAATLGVPAPPPDGQIHDEPGLHDAPGGGPATLAPEVDGRAGTDPFGVGARVGDATAGGDDRWDLTDGRGDLGGPGDVDLAASADLHLDPGYSLDDLVGAGSVDGRTHDAFDGVGSGDATGPADPAGMTSDGFVDSVLSWFGGGATTTQETGGDDAGTPATPPPAPTDGSTDTSTLTTPGTAYSDSEGVQTKGTAPVDSPLKGIADFFMGKKNIDGSVSEREKQMQKALEEDDLPPDHPDYGGGGEPRPPGSETTDAIDTSLDLGLGGQRGGDVDPDRQGSGDPYDAEAAITDYEDVLVDPGEDGFSTGTTVDESYLPDADDLASPHMGGAGDDVGME